MRVCTSSNALRAPRCSSRKPVTAASSVRMVPCRARQCSSRGQLDRRVGGAADEWAGVRDAVSRFGCVSAQPEPMQQVAGCTTRAVRSFTEASVRCCGHSYGVRCGLGSPNGVAAGEGLGESGHARAQGCCWDSICSVSPVVQAATVLFARVSSLEESLFATVRSILRTAGMFFWRLKAIAR